MESKPYIILRAWIFFSGLVAWVLAIVMVFRGKLLWAAVCALYAIAADRAGRFW